MHSFLKDKKSLAVLRKRIEARCLKTYFRKDPEDLFQNVCVFLIERPQCSSTLDQILIDVLRQESGRKDSPMYDVRQLIDNPHSLDAPLTDGEDVNIEEKFASLFVEESLYMENPYEAIDARLDFQKTWKSLSKAERKLLYESYVLGKLGSELAKERKTHEVTISKEKHALWNKVKPSLAGECES